MAGMQNSATPATTDVASNIASVGANTLSGAAAGALSGAAIGAAGGPIGAVGGAVIGGGVALISSGLNAWLGNRQASAERDRQNALNAEANRIRQQEIARDEKWRVQHRLDTIEEAQYQRKKYQEEVNRKRMTETAQKLQGALATNNSLKAQWAQYGFN
jgi:phage tail tape-measure protein